MLAVRFTLRIGMFRASPGKSLQPRANIASGPYHTHMHKSKDAPNGLSQPRNTEDQRRPLPVTEIDESGRVDSSIGLNMKGYAGMLAVLDLAQADALRIKSFQCSTKVSPGSSNHRFELDDLAVPRGRLNRYGRIPFQSGVVAIMENQDVVGNLLSPSCANMVPKERSISGEHSARPTPIIVLQPGLHILWTERREPLIDQWRDAAEQPKPWPAENVQSYQADHEDGNGHNEMYEFLPGDPMCTKTH